MTVLKFGAVAMIAVLAGCSKQPASVTATTQAVRSSTDAQALQVAQDAGAMIPAEKAARAAAGKQDNADYYIKLHLNEFMPHVMQYAGDGIWKRQGWIIDKDGEHSLFPKNDQEWEDAESAARTLAEVTNVLLIPGRRAPDPAWDDAVAAVRNVALEAADAAEKKDKDAWFRIGGELDEACDVCHKQFDPTFKNGPKVG